MSTYVVDWAQTQAPTKDIYESYILSMLAGHADREGCGVFPAVETMAKACHCDKKTIRNRINDMRKRGLLIPGDPTSPGALKHAKLRGGHKPRLYDIPVPYEWYSPQMMANINEEREAAGRPLLTPENRPPLGPPPPRKRRSDLGKERPERRKENRQRAADQRPETESETPPETPAEAPPEAPAEAGEKGSEGLIVPPQTGVPTDGEEGLRGDYQSTCEGTDSPFERGLIVPQTCNKKPVTEPVIGGASRRPPEPPADKNPPARAASLPTEQRNPRGDLTTARAERGVPDESGDASEPPPRPVVRTILRVGAR